MIGETMIGSTVGHYEIVEKIGSGGMGVVYLARDTRLDRPVALKFVRTPSDPGGARQLLREARAASALNHPGICTVHEVGESGSDPYIVMEYVEGETLSDRMAARPFSPDDVFATPVPEGLPSFDKKVSGLVAFLAFHDAYHTGQVSFLRKWLGYGQTVG